MVNSYSHTSILFLGIAFVFKKATVAVRGRIAGEAGLAQTPLFHLHPFKDLCWISLWRGAGLPMLLSPFFPLSLV